MQIFLKMTGKKIMLFLIDSWYLDVNGTDNQELQRISQGFRNSFHDLMTAPFEALVTQAFCLRRETISWCPPSVYAFPLFQTVLRSLPAIQLTLIVPVTPLAEWVLISTSYPRLALI